MSAFAYYIHICYLCKRNRCLIVMGKIQNNVATQYDKQQELENRFAYLSKEERDRLLYGNDFVKVPTEELKRLRIDGYSYLM